MKKAERRIAAWTDRKRWPSCQKLQFFILHSAFLIFLLAGCTRLPQANLPPQTSSGSAETGLEAAVGPLRKSSNLSTCRGVLQQLNADLNRASSGKVPLLTET